ncbi:hypothetical protein PINS_up013032 [Pythium insidiosum]|nr:hypothetical protein PINS_up013032 [Pythium insidiosum]
MSKKKAAPQKNKRSHADDAPSSKPPALAPQSAGGDAQRSSKKRKQRHASAEDAGEDVDLSTLSFDDALAVGLAFEQLSSFDSAVAAFSRAVELRPTHYKALTRLADVLTTVGDHAEALPHYVSASRLPEADASLWLRLGMAYTALEKVDGAIESCERARQLAVEELRKHDSEDNRRTYGMALGALASCWGMMKDDLSVAVRLYEEAVATFPTNANLHFNLATMQRAAEQSSAAIASLRRAIELDGDVPDFYEELLECVSDPKETKELTAKLEQARARLKASGANDDDQKQVEEDDEEEEEEEEEEDDNEEEEEDDDDDDDEDKHDEDDN